MKLVRRGRPAMATTFEVWLGGDDEEHLDAVAEAALDEVARVERLLSRFDPAAEVARVNREARTRPVRVDRELLGILLDCRSWFARTDGYFDILWVGGGYHGFVREPVRGTTPEGTGSRTNPWHPEGRAAHFQELGIGRRFDDRLMIDEESGAVRLLDPSARIDFGGYGKGYALDAALRIIDGFGVASAFLHGGTSSALARGLDPSGNPWRVGIRDPFAEGPDAELARVDLIDRGFSSSAAFGPGMGRSDIIDPALGAPRSEQAAVSAIASTAAEAEVFSTALLAMGRARMGQWIGEGKTGTSPGAVRKCPSSTFPGGRPGPARIAPKRTQPGGPRVAWVDARGIEWLDASSMGACHEAGADRTA